MCDYNDIFEEIDNNVTEALKNARENGYDFKGVAIEDVAEDMVKHDSAFEGIPIDVMVAILKRWLW